jgi:hypothetical protein
MGANHAVPECSAGGLKIGQKGTDAAAGHQSMLLTFTNVGAGTCFLQGYPGVAGLSQDNQVLLNAAREPRGYLGGLPSGQSQPPRIVLAPGRVAYATVEALDAATNGSESCAGGGAISLLVTAPDQRASTAVPDEIRICADFQVHPIVSSPQF